MPFNTLLKYLSFGCICLIIPVMAGATVLEKVYGSEFVCRHIYTSMLMIILWGVISMSSIWYMLRLKLYRKIAVFSLHLSLIAILIGALTTHLTGCHGQLHLRAGENPVTEYTDSHGTLSPFPFKVCLMAFKLEYYPGTASPSDFVSDICINDGDKDFYTSVSMNRICAYRNFRLYQSGYDADLQGSIFTVTTDPCGIAVTYTGYVWLLISVIMFFFQKKTLFCDILKRVSLYKGVIMTMLLLISAFRSLGAPSSLPRDIADEFGNLYIYYNGRIAPLDTYAHDFVKKIYGGDSYRGLTPEQIVTGWIFFYDEWKNEPFIKIKDDDIRHVLEIKESYARLSDFIGPEGFRLDPILNQPGSSGKVFEANEKFNIVSALVTGSSVSIYPFRDRETDRLDWFALKDKPTRDMPFDQWLFIRNSMDLVAEKVAMKDYDGISQLLSKIQKYQVNEGGGQLPSAAKIKAEIFYNRYSGSRIPAVFCVVSGIMLFIIFLSYFVKSKILTPWIVYGSKALLCFLAVYLSVLLGMRWYISGHIPLSNGFETMQFLAWCTAVAVLIMSRYFKPALPFGFLICGFALLVAMLGESSPQITNLMPVLHSPLLSVHVMVIMLAYTLLSLIMMNGVAALFIHRSNRVAEKICFLQDFSRLLLYPAVFLLVFGIFIGAVWANVSWGRYWGWDPKEVWALITFLVYVLPLHSISLSLFRKPIFFHSYMVFAFLSVVITYFGVNYFLGGMHSYAV